MRRLLGCALGLVLASSAAAETPVADLARPPADAEQFAIVSSAGRHGSVQQWTTPDGTRMARTSLLLRGQVWEDDEAVRLGPDGAIIDYRLRGISPNGDVAETFSVAGGTARWKSPIDGGSTAYRGPAMYLPAGPGTLAGNLLNERLAATPGQAVALLPGGQGRAEKLASTTVGTGAARRTVTLWAATGIGGTPTPFWTDEKGRAFATLNGLAIIRAGYEGEQDKLQTLQDEALAKQSPVLARTLATVPGAPVAFADVRAFVDGRFVDHQTVVVDKGRIVAVGPAASVKLPAGAMRIAGAGRTLVPGLWDSHMHVADDYTGPNELAMGVTSVRDPGNTVALTKARAARRAAGDLLFPHVYPSVIIDGKGPNSAQGSTVVTSEAEAIAAVRQAKADGLTGVKFYGTFNPAWVRPAAAEAHRLGLHVHGHLPQGMRTAQAIDDGYDEVTHIYFTAMQFMPDDVVARSNTIQRFEGTGRYMRDVDLGSPAVEQLIRTMAAKKIVADPTLVVVESLYMPENGDLSPSYAPYVGKLPPAVERSFRQGGFAPPKDVGREGYRASFRKLVQLVGRMHQAGVPIVAGTDGSGLELVRELELYVDAGFTPAAALESATIVPARNVGADGHTGSIAVGKDADLLLVDGDPSRRIGDLRHAVTVMMDGKLMDAAKLRAAVGISARPALTRGLVE